MTEPTTEAGRRVLRQVTPHHSMVDVPYWVRTIRDDILAIEAEARASAATACGEPVAQGISGGGYPDQYDPCTRPKGHDEDHDPTLAYLAATPATAERLASAARTAIAAFWPNDGGKDIPLASVAWAQDAIVAHMRAAVPSLFATPATTDRVQALAAALEKAARNNHYEGQHDPPTFQECADSYCREATAALGSAAPEGDRPVTDGSEEWET